MNSRVVLDTQLLVLLVVGLTSVEIIKKHKRLAQFEKEDFDLLAALLRPCPGLILLPNIISETSNLLNQHRDPERAAIIGKLAQLVNGSEESYIPSSVVVGRQEYGRLGVTDTAILELCASNSCKLLTADAKLYVAAEKRGLQAINFNHSREQVGIFKVSG